MLSIPPDPFPVTKGKGKIWRTEPTLETSGLDEENVDKVKRSIFVLQRTRESLSATLAEEDLDSGGSLLDRALVRQLSIRKAELDNLLPKNVSVIVRSSTPNPEATCEEIHEDLVSPHIPTHSQFAPEDFSYPLNNLLNTLGNQPESVLPLPPHHPVMHRVGAAGVIANRSAPEVPWSPVRSCGPEGERGYSSLQEILVTPEYSPLLAPLFVTEAAKMNAADEAKKVCNSKIRKFHSLLRRYEPDGYGSIDPARGDKWVDEVTTALEEMVDSIEKMSIKHGQTLGTAEVTAWKMHVDDGESRFRDFASKLMAKTVSQPQSHNENSGSVPVNASIPQPGVVSFDSTAVNATRTAKADIEVDADIISSEGKELAEEVNKFEDLCDATDVEIEEHVQKI